MPLRLGRIAVAMALPALLLSCSSLADEPAVGATFAARASATCQHALQLKQAEGPFPVPSFNPTSPDVSQLTAVAAFLQKTDATFSTWSDEMSALGQPPDGTAPWADLVAAVKRHRDLNRDQIGAAGRGDAATFAADYQLGVQTQVALLSAATAAGVPDCAKVDR